MNAVNAENVLRVGVYETRPNRMFTDAQRAGIRFLRFTQAVPCAECGRRSRAHWTVLYSFKALSMAVMVPRESDKVHMPLTPVCQQHLLKPAELVIPKKTRMKK